MNRLIALVFLVTIWLWQLSSAGSVAAAQAAAADLNSAPVVVRSLPAGEGKIKEDFVVARVKSVAAPQTNKSLLESTGISSKQELVEVEILEGPLKGKSYVLSNEITDNPAFNIKVEPGKELVVSAVTESPDESPELNIADYHRAPSLGILLALFLAAFLFFGGKDGLKSLAGLVLAIALIGLVLLPLSLHGFDPLLAASIISILAAATTMVAVAGFSKKALAALLGTFGGVIIAGLAAHLVIGSAPLTGLSSEEAQILRGSLQFNDPKFFTGLLAAAMLIGALGVIMDVGISIASAVWELKQSTPNMAESELYLRGMNVGRDIMGTMTSTLVLAYAGSALPLLLLMAHAPSIKLLNLDLVATEIASALTGSLGLVCTIPLTALAAAKIMSRSSPCEQLAKLAEDS